MGSLRKFIINFLCSLGFINDRRVILRGPRERLHYPDYPNGPGIIFNTNSGSIFVGNKVVFGHDVMVLTGKHEFDGVSFKKHLPDKNDIHLGDGCWIASGAIILGGVSVGAGSLVCAGAVVTKDVPPGVMVAGIPAKVIKQLNQIPKPQATVA
ncbi:MAG: sugar O-acetyltransferase [Verrucomicrobiales bacterium]|nr:sugar O-acetyltransferase [Verrucomicrobiales bacterium]